jgi:drug/metabolite transporter (DMT)-like permease
MEAKLSPGTGIVILIVAATSFAANHVSARIAFDHGASVAAGVVTRATGTALVLLLLLKLQGVALSVPRALWPRLAGAGLLVAVQSYCLYSAVALIPAALALLVFQSSAVLYLLLSWATGKEKPHAMALAPMLLALAGLVLVLNITPDKFSVRWAELGTGVLWAAAAAVSFAFVYYANANALRALDGRLRTFGMTAVTALVVLAGSLAADALAAPRDATGWAGLALLTAFYCIAMTVTFSVLPRVPAASAAALNFEPIALLALGWIFLGQGVTPLQIAGALVTVGALAWLGLLKR